MISDAYPATQSAYWGTQPVARCSLPLRLQGRAQYKRADSRRHHSGDDRTVRGEMGARTWRGSAAGEWAGGCGSIGAGCGSSGCGLEGKAAVLSSFCAVRCLCARVARAAQLASVWGRLFRQGRVVAILYGCSGQGQRASLSKRGRWSGALWSMQRREGEQQE